jgi:hypothetical protein
MNFTWGGGGAKQSSPLERIKEYLMTPLVLRAPRRGKEFRLHVTAKERVIDTVLVKEEGNKEFIGAFVSRRLLEAETWYVFIERLCLSLYYACSKFRHYILASHCMVVCQHDVIRYMLHKPKLSGRLGKWAYSLVEYGLAFESLRARKGQVVADFVVDHMIAPDGEAWLIEVVPWKLFFDRSVCSQGQGVGCVIVPPNNAHFDNSARLEFTCTNN